MKLEKPPYVLHIADELDRDGELRLIIEGEYEDTYMYLNKEQAREVVVQIETAFANGGRGLFDEM